MRLALLAVLTVAACTEMPGPVTPVAGASYTARNTLAVTPTGPDTFHVGFGGLIGDTDFWCAAGDYVMHALGRPVSTPIYRASPPPRHAGQGIDFTLDRTAAVPSGITTFGASGPGFTAAAAEEFCAPFPRFPWDW